MCLFHVVFPDSDDENMDPRACNENSSKRLKRAHEHMTSQRNDRKLHKVVAKPSLPSQSSNLARTLRTFIKFLMGMPASPADYPANPTLIEIASWESWDARRYCAIKKHMDNFRTKHANLGKERCKQAEIEELARIRRESNPPQFTPTPFVPCAELNIPKRVKTSCEDDLQLAGFGRFTFRWGFSFESSSWNAGVGSIATKHYEIWAKTQRGLVWGEMEHVTGVLDRWVQGQAKEMEKLSLLGPEGHQTVKKQKAFNLLKGRKRKQVRS